MKSEDKKKLIAAYKERDVIGGVYVIKNNATGKLLLESTLELAGSKNRFEFSQKTGSAVSFKLQKDWNTYGKDAFTFEVLEELKKGESQTAEEFGADIKLLKEIWQEKLSAEDLY